MDVHGTKLVRTLFTIKSGASPAWTIGNSNASVSIEVFNDYQCPPCGTLNKDLKKIKAKYKDNIQIIFRNYPLTRMHPNALLAARTAGSRRAAGTLLRDD